MPQDTPSSFYFDDEPEFFDLEAFNKLAYRFGEWLLSHPARATKIRDNCCFLADPDELALHLKQRLIEAAPEWFSTWAAAGHSRLSTGGTFRIIRPIPKGAMIDAYFALGLFRPNHSLNTDGNIRHNSRCRWFANTKQGHYCGPNDGKPCGQCGG